MEPILKMSVISTLKDLTEAYVEPMVSWLHHIAMEGGGGGGATICIFSFIVPNLETKGHQGKKNGKQLLKFLFTHRRLKGSWK